MECRVLIDTRHTSHVTRHTSHVTRQTPRDKHSLTLPRPNDHVSNSRACKPHHVVPNAKRHNIKSHASRVTRHASRVTRHTPYVTLHVTCISTRNLPVGKLDHSVLLRLRLRLQVCGLRFVMEVGGLRVWLGLCGLRWRLLVCSL